MQQRRACAARSVERCCAERSRASASRSTRSCRAARTCWGCVASASCPTGASRAGASPTRSSSPSEARAKTSSARRSARSRGPVRCEALPCPRRPLACARQNEKFTEAQQEARCAAARRRAARACERTAMSVLEREQVFSIIRAHLADELDVDPSAIVDATRFREDLEADSLDLYTLVQELEDTYGVSMSDEQAAQILTVGQAVDFVLAHDDGAANGRA